MSFVWLTADVVLPNCAATCIIANMRIPSASVEVGQKVEPQGRPSSDVLPPAVEPTRVVATEPAALASRPSRTPASHAASVDAPSAAARPVVDHRPTDGEPAYLYRGAELLGWLPYDGTDGHRHTILSRAGIHGTDTEASHAAAASIAEQLDAPVHCLAGALQDTRLMRIEAHLSSASNSDLRYVQQQLRRYQREQGLPVTGAFDAATRARLELMGS